MFLAPCLMDLGRFVLVLYSLNAASVNVRPRVGHPWDAAGMGRLPLGVL